MRRTARITASYLARWCLLSAGALCWPDVAGALSTPPPTEPGSPSIRQLQTCAAFDLYHVTSIEDAGRTFAGDHDGIAAAAFQVLAARQLCRDGHVGQAFDMYSRIAVEEPSARWLR